MQNIETDNKKIALMKKYVCIFRTGKEINVAYHLQKKLKGNILARWSYYAIPIVVFSLNMGIVILNNVLLVNDKAAGMTFSYSRDLSNSVGLNVLYFLSYFLSAYFAGEVENFLQYVDLDDGQTQESGKKGIVRNIVLGLILFIFGLSIGFGFYRAAAKNSGIWTCHMNVGSVIYYSLFLGITWYHSLSLLVMALSASAIIYWAFQNEKIQYSPKEFNKNKSIVYAVNILVATLSYGLFYIIGSALFIVNDKVAFQEEYGVENTFASDINGLILIVIVSLLVVIVCVPWGVLLEYMKRRKIKLLREYDDNIEKSQNDAVRGALLKEKNELQKQSLIDTTWVNKMIIALSVLIPLVGVIIQAMALV